MKTDRLLFIVRTKAQAKVLRPALQPGHAVLHVGAEVGLHHLGYTRVLLAAVHSGTAADWYNLNFSLDMDGSEDEE